MTYAGYDEGHTDVADPADRRVRICASRCTTCIFRPGNLMHLNRNRVRGMVRTAAAANGHITCHQTLQGNARGLPGAVCQGWMRLRSARESFVFVAIRLFKRVALLDTTTGQLTNHDNYRLEEPMGTWGTGPLDSDIALDFRHELAMLPDPAARGELLSKHLEALAGCATSHHRRLTGYGRLDADTALHAGVAACALIAEKQAGEYLYGYPPDPDDTDGDPQFRLEMLPEVTAPLRGAALRAIHTARLLVGHPDLPVWGTDTDELVYRATLEAVADRLAPQPNPGPHMPSGSAQ